jgi:DNA-binding NarL/FixJ family response regulator
MHQDIKSALNEGARDSGRPISEPENFASRPWTRADDDKLRRLARTGLSVRAIGIRMNRTETAVRSHAKRLQVILRKIRQKQQQMG